MNVRTEADFLGTLEVPADRYYGIETLRAMRNFPITGISIAAMPELLGSFAWVKSAAAQTNMRAGQISPEQCNAIVQACDEVRAGELNEHFTVDVIQGGAGTSSNMNVNEVLANRGLELLGHELGDYQHLHPKDHVNKCQSTNDVYATAVRLTVVQLNERLADAVAGCVAAFEARAAKFDHVAKLGRTQLQDAVPITVGQELRGFAAALAEDIDRIRDLRPLFLEVNLGGTAIGTGVGVSEYYDAHIIEALQQTSGLPVTRAKDRVEATWDNGLFVLYGGLLKRVATKLSKIANDLRLLSSGPRGGFGEFRLPEQQPGSSIMPGKVNPVIPEVVNQACFRVFGADTTITFAAESGQLQLNAMVPVMLWSIYDAGTSLIAAIDTLVKNCINGLEVDEARCAEHLNNSTAKATLIAGDIGYGSAAGVALKMLQRGCSFEEAVREVRPDDADQVLEKLSKALGV